MKHIAHTLRALALTAFLALPAMGATFTVTNTDDSGAGSLRQTLADAAAASGADTIEFAAGLSGGTIATASEILVDDADGVTVDGSGLAAAVTIDGGAGTNRLIKLNPSRSLTLIGLTFANGHGGTSDAGRGGAINSNGTLTLTRCTFTSNSAAAGGAVRNTGSLSATDCTFANNTSPNQGGAIHSPGSMTLTRCTFTGNSADEGGATYGNSATVTQCTFSGNTGRSGAAIIFFGTMDLTHSTVWGNIVSPPGGTAVSIRSAGGTLTLTNSVVEDIMNFGTFTRVGANIVATLNNVGGTDSGPAAITADPTLGALASNGGPTQTRALLAGSPAIDASVGSAITSDQRGLSLYGTADLGAYEYKGGIITVANSADSGAGSLRQALADAAAFAGENTIEFDASLSGQTITLASEIAVNDDIALDASGLPGGLTLSGGGVARLFSVASGSSLTLVEVTLTGGNGVGAAVNGWGGAIYNAGTTTLTRCTLSGNTAGTTVGAPEMGGAIFNDTGGTIALTHCTVAGNACISNRGGAMLNLGTATFTHCTVSANSGHFDGGGIRTEGALTLENTIVSGNVVPDGFPFDIFGGGSSTLTRVGLNLVGSVAIDGVINGSGTISSADPLLGALANNGGRTKTMALLAGSPAIDAAVGATITSDQRGKLLYGAADLGAYEFKGGTVVVTNVADSGAGSLWQALAVAAGSAGSNSIEFDASLSGQTITLASALAISDADGVTIDASALPGGLTLDGNNACRIFNIGTGSALNLVALNITRGNGDGTPYNLGGAISNDGTLTASRCSFYDNHAAHWGGAINNVSASAAIYLTSCTLTNNSAGQYGGGLSAYGSTAVLTHCTVSGNSSYAFGAAFGSVDYHYCIVTGNTASSLPDHGNPVGPNLIGENAKLAPLGNYGGPTKTMRLLAGSAAIDAATGSTIASDQRGFSIIGTPDLGALESHAPTAVEDLVKLPTATTTTIDVLANDSSPDNLALTITKASRPRGGTVAILGGTSIQYTPNSRHADSDSFSYTITDPNGETSTATVRIRNPFPGFAGRFQSLIVTGTPSRDGLATVRLSRTGSFSLSLKTATGNYTKIGTLDGDGNGTVTITRTGLPDLTVNFALNVSTGAFSISVDDTTGAVTGSFSKKIRYSVDNPSPDEGKYTMLLPQPEQIPLTQATVTPIVTGGKITGITLTDGGKGYTNVPKVTFNRAAGTGTAATATAIVSDGEVTGFTITNAGTGYTAGTTAELTEPAGLPRGTGYATLNVSASGAVVVAGKLGDGTAFSAGGFMDADETSPGYAGNEPSYPLYSKAYTVAGRIYGTLKFRDVTDVSDIDGKLYWNKPGQTSAQMFQKGFATTSDSIGSFYVAPTSGDYVLDLPASAGNAEVVIEDGDLASAISKDLSVTPASPTASVSNKLTVVTTGSDALAAAVAASTGMFTGSFVPDPTKPGVRTGFSGVLFQKQNLGAAVFSGSKQTGTVMISSK